jgi:hypothetical protein
MALLVEGDEQDRHEVEVNEWNSLHKKLPLQHSWIGPRGESGLRDDFLCDEAGSRGVDPGCDGVSGIGEMKDHIGLLFYGKQ